MNGNVEKNSVNDSLAELCNRYRKRNEAYHAGTEFVDQKSKEILTRTIAPDSYRMSGASPESVDQYRNGGDGGRKYMTGGDFAVYYNSKREYTPEPNVNLDSAVIFQRADRERYGRNGGENIKNIISEKRRKDELRKSLEESSPKQPKYVIKGNRLISTDKAERKKSGSKRRAGLEKGKRIVHEEVGGGKDSKNEKSGISKAVVFAAILIIFSLLLILGSTLMLMLAKKEQPYTAKSANDYFINENRHLQDTGIKTAFL